MQQLILIHTCTERAIKIGDFYFMTKLQEKSVKSSLHHMIMIDNIWPYSQFCFTRLLPRKFWLFITKCSIMVIFDTNLPYYTENTEETYRALQSTFSCTKMCAQSQRFCTTENARVGPINYDVPGAGHLHQHEDC